MRSTDSTWNRLVDSGNFQVQTVAVINGVEYSTITAPNIKRGMFAGNGVSVGGCISATLDFTVKTTNVIPKGATITIKSRLTDGTDYSLWKNMGTFFVAERYVDGDLITLHCCDAMMKGGQTYVDNSTSLVWPKSMQKIAKQCAERLGVQIDDRTIINPDSSPEHNTDSMLTVSMGEGETYTLYAYAENGTVKIDWGDGSQNEQMVTSSSNNNTHVYDDEAIYDITLSPIGSARVVFYKPDDSSQYADNYLISALVGSKSKIHDNAFYYCQSLLNLDIIDNIYPVIGDYAFFGCIKLKKIILPECITTIGNTSSWCGTFGYADELEEIRIGSRVTSIKGHAFNNLTALKTLKVAAVSPPSMGDYPFWFTTNATVYVPYESVAAYESRSWSQHLDLAGYDPESDEDISIYGDYIVYKPDNNKTILDLLGYIAGVHAGNWIITPDNKLRLVTIHRRPADSFNIIDYNYSRIVTNDGYDLVWDNASEDDEYSIDSDTYSADEYDTIYVPVLIGNANTSKVSSITRVSASNGNGVSYTAGDDSGKELKIPDNPCITQGICDTLLSVLYGLEYEPFTATNVVYNPAGEIGDNVIIGDKVRSVLCSEASKYDIYYSADINAPASDETETEYPYETVTQQLTYSISQKTDQTQVESIIEQKADSIRLKADKISWESQYSSLTADGKLTIKNGAVIEGGLQASSRIDSESVHSYDTLTAKVDEGQFIIQLDDATILSISGDIAAPDTTIGRIAPQNDATIIIGTSNNQIQINNDEFLPTVNGQSGVSASFSIKDTSNVTHKLTFVNGILVGFTNP